MTSALLIERNQKSAVDKEAQDLGSAMMISAVMSSQSAVVKRSARAGLAMMKSAVTSENSRELQCNQQLVLEVSDSKTMSFELIDTTAFCLRAKIQQMLFAMSQDDVPVASYSGSSRRLQRVATSRQRIQSQATVYPVAGYSALHIQSTGNNQSQYLKIHSVAKQLTN
ncbi:ankyrin repeat domain-containing protein 50-like [Dorcoceras hygrometricum]|uniref:Ankyrin repeat domain-containing protein 50-like n=1 Tax=Dorcoceras hygrometricum TaxID=472368 RepID=A0A2Z7CV50_9LAMI|nr:ankyrin repeat domain-containing protein 50-like [Dorcoceras hygrometricum]